MALHRRIKHDYANPIHTHVHTVHCPMCMLYFHNRVRVLNHLKYRSRACRLALLLHGPCISKETALSLDGEFRAEKRRLYALGLRAHAASTPVSAYWTFSHSAFCFFVYMAIYIYLVMGAIIITLPLLVGNMFIYFLRYFLAIFTHT